MNYAEDGLSLQPVPALSTSHSASQSPAGWVLRDSSLLVSDLLGKSEISGTGEQTEAHVFKVHTSGQLLALQHSSYDT